MFRYARIRLTLLYLFIIAFISLSFTAIIYRNFVLELEQGFIRAESRLRGLSVPRHIARELVLREVNEAKKPVVLRLLLLNGAILFISGFGGYFLAGKTLSPIEESLEEQKRFIADASHELRTPLTSLKTEIEVGLRDKKMTVVEAKKLLRSNLSDIDNMKDLANYLLSLSRYESGGDKFSIQSVDLKDVVNQAVRQSNVLATKNRIKIIKKVKQINIKGNYQNLVELVSILLNNAIKYSYKNSKVYVRVLSTRRFVMIEVEDFGVGIKKEDQKHIFDRFYRVDQSRSKNKIDGYGLGLSIAKSISELYGSRLFVKSEIGKGSKFTVQIPRLF